MKYRVRFVAPKPGEWQEIDGENATDAIQRLHEMDFKTRSLLYINEKDELREDVYFAMIQVESEGDEPFISRIFHRGIYRSGGVKVNKRRTLVDVASELNLKMPPDELLSDGWEGEQKDWE